MLNGSDKLEFKREVNNSLVKEIVAFANTKGGTIIVGYDDDGKLIGLDNAKEQLENISNKLHDSIEPNIDFLVNLKLKN